MLRDEGDKKAVACAAAACSTLHRAAKAVGNGSDKPPPEDDAGN